MMATRRSLAAAVALLSGLAAAGVAVPSDAARPDADFDGDLTFHADAAAFPAPDGRGETCLYVEVPLSSLRFAAADQGPPRAAVRISAVFSDAGGMRIAGDEWSYGDLTGSADRKENEGRALTRRACFRLPAGEILVRVRVEEADGDRFGELAFETRVPANTGAGPAVSDLVFGLCGDAAASAAPEDLEGPVLPHPSRSYGNDAPSACVLARLADGLDVPDTAYTVRYEVKDANGRRRERETVSVSRSGGRGTMLLRPRLTRLGLGRYRLQVEVELDGRRAEREGWFELDESRVAFREDEEMIRTVLGYVATNEELIRLEDDPVDSLETIYRRFWDRRDPTPDTRANEALVEFMKRVEYASQNFGVLEPGWRSDRGRIYIKFGPPDRIERMASAAAGPPTETWHYSGRNATFVFQDLDGFGRYVLSRTLRD